MATESELTTAIERFRLATATPTATSTAATATPTAMTTAATATPTAMVTAATAAPTAMATEATATPTAPATTTATTVPGATVPNSAVALAYRHGWSAGHQAAVRGESDTAFMEIETFEQQQQQPRQHQQRHEPSRYQRGFEDGFHAGVEIRTAPQQAVIVPLIVSQVPPRSVLNLMIGHTNWLLGVLPSDSSEYAVGVMTRDWLLSLE
jgi:hypothetical protein